MKTRPKRNSCGRGSLDISSYKSYNLSKIEEDPKEIDEEDHKKHSYKLTSRSIQPSDPLPPLPKAKDISTKDVDYFKNFLCRLQPFPGVYKYFISQGIKNKVLNRLKISKSGSYSSKARLESIFDNPLNYVSEDLSIETDIANIIPTALSPVSGSKTVTNESKSRETNRRVSTTLSINLSKIQIKLPVLDKNSSSLFEKFKAVAGASNHNYKDYKLNFDNYKEYLSARYPPEMIELMLKWLYHGMSVNFDGWVQDMQKFINFSNEKHSKFAFELYDYNKDRYVCINDAFRAMSFKNSLIFDDDIVKIRQGFVSKTTNDLNGVGLFSKKKKSKKKNKAFMSAEDEIKFKVLPVHPLKPEALTLDEFMKLNFYNGKPKIVFDLIKYLTGIDINDRHADTPKSQKYKKTDETSEETQINFSSRDKIQTEPKFD